MTNNNKLPTGTTPVDIQQNTYSMWPLIKFTEAFEKLSEYSGNGKPELPYDVYNLFMKSFENIKKYTIGGNRKKSGKTRKLKKNLKKTRKQRK